MWHYQLPQTKPLTKGTDSSINNISGDTYITNNDTNSLFVVKIVAEVLTIEGIIKNY